MTIDYAKRMATMVVDRAESSQKEYGPSDRYLIPISAEQIEGLKTLIQATQLESLSAAIDRGLDRAITNLENALHEQGE